MLVKIFLLNHVHFILDGRWIKNRKPLIQIDTGLTPAVWGVDRSKKVYTIVDGSFKKIPGTNFRHVTSGAAGIWAINGDDFIFFRTGVTPQSPSGQTWQRIPGLLRQIDSGPSKIVCGVNKVNMVYCRRGISSLKPSGSGWIKLDGKMKYISCGVFGHWAVDPNNRVRFRQGVKSIKPHGSTWTPIGSIKVHQIESGPDGAVWAVHIYKGVYTRLGIKPTSPTGLKWKCFTKKKLVSISVGPGTLYGIDRNGKSFEGEASSFVGKNGLPKKPAGKMRLSLLFISLFNY